MKWLVVFVLLLLTSCASVMEMLDEARVPDYKTSKLNSIGYVNGEAGFKCLKLNLNEVGGFVDGVLNYFSGAKLFETVLISDMWFYKNGFYNLSLPANKLTKASNTQDYIVGFAMKYHGFSKKEFDLSNKVISIVLPKDNEGKALIGNLAYFIRVDYKSKPTNTLCLYTTHDNNGDKLISYVAKQGSSGLKMKNITGCFNNRLYKEKFSQEFSTDDVSQILIAVVGDMSGCFKKFVIENNVNTAKDIAKVDIKDSGINKECDVKKPSLYDVEVGYNELKVSCVDSSNYAEIIPIQKEGAYTISVLKVYSKNDGQLIIPESVKLKGLPAILDAGVILFYKDVFKGKGLEYSNLTWDDFDFSCSGEVNNGEAMSRHVCKKDIIIRTIEYSTPIYFYDGSRIKNNTLPLKWVVSELSGKSDKTPDSCKEIVLVLLYKAKTTSMRYSDVKQMMENVEIEMVSN